MKKIFHISTQSWYNLNMKMEPASIQKHQEEPRINKTKSFSEQLLGPTLTDSDIPYEIKLDANFLKQVKERKKLIEAYTSYKLDAENTDNLNNLYAELSEVFEKDESFARAALYIPFDLLPNVSISKNQEALTFISSYKKAFISLLNQMDFRADFVDGDVLDTELRQGEAPERIVKVLHLLPWLMRKSIFSQEEVIAIIKKADESTLIKTLADVLPILYRESLLDDDIFNVLSTSPHKILRDLIGKIKKEDINHPKTNLENITPKEILTSFMEAHEAALKRISMLPTSQERKIWQTEMQTELLQEEFAHKLLSHMHDLDTSTVEKLIEQKNSLLISLIITSLRIKAGEEFEEGHQVSSETKDLITHILLKTSNYQDVPIMQARRKLISHSYQYGVRIESLESPQFIQEEETLLTKKYFEKLSSCAKFIEEDPFLNKYLYPVTISLGSHAKGYAKETSDTDMGVFIRKDVNENQRNEIQGKLKQMFLTLNINGSCMEFWTDENTDGITIKNYENPDPKRGDNSLTHPLTGQWVGNLTETKKLRQDLMKMYLESDGKTVDVYDARSVWLKDLEHNMLQYRLMHKGYASHIPPYSIKKKTSNFPIDGSSMFYDEGYRGVAFDLYLKKVFLPVVSK